jgi:tRNA-specific 2-thiouridylase
VPGGDYAAFVAKKQPDVARAGAIVDERGAKLGEHGGVHRYTIGQRKGLGIAAPQPLYVLRLDSASRTVVVGARDALEQTRLTASGVNWISTDAPGEWMQVAAQIRHRHAAALGRVRALAGGRAELEFETPQSAITPGQAVVLYDDDVVVGGGWID